MIMKHICHEKKKTQCILYTIMEERLVLVITLVAVCLSVILLSADTLAKEGEKHLESLSFSGEMQKTVGKKTKLKKKTIIIYVGQTSKIKVVNGKIRKCSVQNKKIAAVSKKGIIRGKKAGKTVVLVKTKNGKTLRCKVVVKKKAISSGKSAVEQYGALQVKGKNLVDKNGNPIQLRGISTHGLSWFPQYCSKDTFSTLKSTWNVNCVRLAMYTAEYNGYCTGDEANRQRLKKLVCQGIDSATELGMYVIVDWHILSDGNPGKYEKKSEEFFQYIAAKYKSNSNVIYEICNEPNQGTSWQSIKNYAGKIIPIIKAQDKDAVILVGTPNWSQELDKAVQNPIAGYSNIMYTLHFYAATHKDDLRNTLSDAVKKGLPVFVSEFSICDASGNGGIDKTSAGKWMNLLDQYKISYVAWGLCNKNETASLIKPSCNKTSNWTKSNLSKTGQWIINHFKG